MGLRSRSRWQRDPTCLAWAAGAQDYISLTRGASPWGSFRGQVMSRKSGVASRMSPDVWNKRAFRAWAVFLGGMALTQPACADVELVALGGAHRVWCVSEFEVRGVPPCENPFNADELAVDAVFTGGAGGEIRLPGFWYRPFTRRLVQRQARNKQGETTTREAEELTPSGEAGWRVRFTPVQEGTHRWRIELRRGAAGAARVQGTGTIAVGPAPEGARGFVRVEPTDRRYFMRDDGTPLPLLGECCCWHGARGTFDYDDWLADFSANGMNYLRLWMWPRAFGIEVLEGERANYNQENAWRLDHVLRTAHAHGAAAMLCLDYHGVFQVKPDMWGGNNYWPQHPYNVATGGPCKTQKDFFTSAEAAALYRKRLRYLIGRYSALPSVMAWQFFNEINNVYRYLNARDVVAWHDRTAQWLKGQDPYRHPITTSFGSKGEQAAMWRLQSLDFAQWHLYLNWAGHYRHPAAMCEDVATRFTGSYGKPIFVGEYGTSGLGWEPAIDPHLRGLQQAVWGGIMTGTAGTSMPWWWEKMHAAKVHRLWRALGAFIEGTGLGRAGWRPLRLPREEREAALGPAEAGKAPFTVTMPCMGKWGQRYKGVMAVTGSGVAEQSELHTFLHGSFQPKLRVPCVLLAEAADNASLTVHVNSVSRDAKLVVSVDGEQVLARDLPNKDGRTKVEGEYDEDVVVPLSPGRHRIELTNTGRDWIALDWVRLTNVRPCLPGDADAPPPVLPYVLTDGEQTLLWVIDSQFNYPSGALEKTPALLSGGQVLLPGLPGGRYAVEWWDTWNGKPTGRRDSVASDHSGLQLSLPDFQVDIAARIRLER